MDRDRMVDVGVGLVSRFGAKTLSLTSVARHAGVARATAYRMFGGREALVTAIVEREVSLLRVKLIEWSATAPDAAGKIHAQVVNVLPYIRNHDALQYVLRKEPEEVVRALVATNDSAGPTLIHQIVSEALPDLEPEIGDQLFPTPRGAAEFLVRTIYSLMLIPDSFLSDEQIAELVVRAIVRDDTESGGAPTGGNRPGPVR
ncbi:TetR/AcrR family transcriptional regulator [Gordonia hongkongensis]|uniref:TetR/AcrR family transcriptional regulator n=1 Tax=Gordonia hongkongensis TaxID=1701090 RepID=A0AAX3T5W3_9ACTN|nr:MULTISPECIES: TetR/AcrR family transcriptional regulator [Gordonia]OCW84827.1 TetR family transcriptional regulator [Nocardia farcinica]QIK46434.1 TetR/AcrR family transcriptional regulator [Gordonia terrae]MBN0975190.1 TetR/AcrR family transcriptional regulator [Gordonia sp. BP-119]MBN0985334.1 TetR/AcrR family transcriptional regulator [Gordonia sp. BP-94]MBR7193238.1 TetR/AcrR family transcriptional regulator [Gordonia sp. SCSIO 19800]